MKESKVPVTEGEKDFEAEYVLNLFVRLIAQHLFNIMAVFSVLFLLLHLTGVDVCFPFRGGSVTLFLCHVHMMRGN